MFSCGLCVHKDISGWIICVGACNPYLRGPVLTEAAGHVWSEWGNVSSDIIPAERGNPAGALQRNADGKLKKGYFRVHSCAVIWYRCRNLDYTCQFKFLKKKKQLLRCCNLPIWLQWKHPVGCPTPQPKWTPLGSFQSVSHFILDQCQNILKHVFGMCVMAQHSIKTRCRCFSLIYGFPLVQISDSHRCFFPICKCWLHSHSFMDMLYVCH